MICVEPDAGMIVWPTDSCVPTASLTRGGQLLGGTYDLVATTAITDADGGCSTGPADPMVLRFFESDGGLVFEEISYYSAVGIKNLASGHVVADAGTIQFVGTGTCSSSPTLSVPLSYATFDGGLSLVFERPFFFRQFDFQRR